MQTREAAGPHSIIGGACYGHYSKDATECNDECKVTKFCRGATRRASMRPCMHCGGDVHEKRKREHEKKCHGFQEEGIDHVVCLECGFKCKRLSGHLRSHRMTVRQYRKKYGSKVLTICSNAVQAFRKTRTDVTDSKRHLTLAFRFPETAAEWDHSKNERTPDEVFARSGDKAWWTCPLGHPSYDAKICNRTRMPNPSGCPVCGEKKNREKTRATMVKNRKMPSDSDMAEWVGLRPPSEFKMDDPANWQCRVCSHLYTRSIGARAKDHQKGVKSCPSCKKRDRSFAVRNPELLKEWDYDKNSRDPLDVPTSDAEKSWWKCEKGHSWEITVQTRFYCDRGCPECREKPKLKRVRVTKSCWRPFEEAREYARSLGVTKSSEWFELLLPVDIPKYPHYTYVEWHDWYDWLGKTKKCEQTPREPSGPDSKPKGKPRKGKSLVEIRSFESACKWMAGSGIDSHDKWHKACRNGVVPSDIPTNPKVYPEWVNWQHWFGKTEPTDDIIQSNGQLTDNKATKSEKKMNVMVDECVRETMLAAQRGFCAVFKEVVGGLPEASSKSRWLGNISGYSCGGGLRPYAKLKEERLVKGESDKTFYRKMSEAEQRLSSDILSGVTRELSQSGGFKTGREANIFLHDTIKREAKFRRDVINKTAKTAKPTKTTKVIPKKKSNTDKREKIAKKNRERILMSKIPSPERIIHPEKTKKRQPGGGSKKSLLNNVNIGNKFVFSHGEEAQLVEVVNHGWVLDKYVCGYKPLWLVLTGDGRGKMHTSPSCLIAASFEGYVPKSKDGIRKEGSIVTYGVPGGMSGSFYFLSEGEGIESLEARMILDSGKATVIRDYSPEGNAFVDKELTGVSQSAKLTTLLQGIDIRELSSWKEHVGIIEVDDKKPATTPTVAATPVAATPVATTPVAATPVAATSVAATSVVTGSVKAKGFIYLDEVDEGDLIKLCKEKKQAAKDAQAEFNEMESSYTEALAKVREIGDRIIAFKRDTLLPAERRYVAVKAKIVAQL